MNTYSWGTGLQISGSISDHHHRFEAVLLLQHAYHFSFAAALCCGLSFVKTGVFTCKFRWRLETDTRPERAEWTETSTRQRDPALTIKVELESVGVDVMQGDV